MPFVYSLVLKHQKEKVKASLILCINDHIKLVEAVYNSKNYKKILGTTIVKYLIQR